MTDVKMWVIAVALTAVLGCGLFSSAVVPTAVEQMVIKAAERIADEVGKELSKVPMTCEFEISNTAGKRVLLMLCEADLE